MTGNMLSFERRAVIALFCASVVVAAAVATVFASLVVSVIEQRRTLADMRAAIAVAAQASTTTKSQATSGQNQAGPSANRRVFQTASPSEFQSALQAFVKEAAARHRGTIDSIQVLKSERVGSLSRVALRLDGVVPEPKLGAFLAELAAGEPLVLVQAMELRPAAVQSNRLNNGGIPSDGVQMRVDVGAFGTLKLAANAVGNERVP